MNILPFYQSKELYSLETTLNQGLPIKITKVALRVLLSATVVVPLAAGWSEVYRKRIVPLESGEPFSWCRTAIKIILTVTLIGYFLVGLNEIWSDFPLKHLEQVEISNINKIKPKGHYQVDFLIRHPKFGNYFTLEQHDYFSRYFNINYYLKNISLDVSDSLITLLCQEKNRKPMPQIFEELFLSDKFVYDRIRLANAISKTEIEQLIEMDSRALANIISSLQPKKLHELLENNPLMIFRKLSQEQQLAFIEKRTPLDDSLVDYLLESRSTIPIANKLQEKHIKKIVESFFLNETKFDYNILIPLIPFDKLVHHIMFNSKYFLEFYKKFNDDQMKLCLSDLSGNNWKCQILHNNFITHLLKCTKYEAEVGFIFKNFSTNRIEARKILLDPQICKHVSPCHLEHIGDLLGKEDKSLFLSQVPDRFFQEFTPKAFLLFYWQIRDNYIQKVSLFPLTTIDSICHTTGFELAFFEHMSHSQRKIVDFKKARFFLCETTRLFAHEHKRIQPCAFNQWIDGDKMANLFLFLNFPQKWWTRNSFTRLLEPKQFVDILIRNDEIHYLDCVIANLRLEGRDSLAEEIIRYISKIGSQEEPKHEASPNKSLDLLKKKKEMLKVLGLEPTATKNEIEKSYKKLALKHHPDRGGDEKIMKEITQAKQFLDEFF